MVLHRHELLAELGEALQEPRLQTDIESDRRKRRNQYLNPGGRPAPDARNGPDLHPSSSCSLALRQDRVKRYRLGGHILSVR
jgi:hypothetical protein